MASSSKKSAKRKEKVEETETRRGGFADGLQQMKGMVLETNFDQASSLISDKETLQGTDDHGVVDDEEAAVREKTLFVENLYHRNTRLSDFIDFFKDVGEVVHVRIIVKRESKLAGYGFVEFATAKEANKALEKKNGESLNGRKVSLTKGHNETSRHEAVAIRKKTLFVAHLSREIEISHIIKFFKDVGQVVHLRLAVNRNDQHVGCGFVEFATANQANKALEKKNGKKLRHCKIFLDLAEIAPYPIRLKHSFGEVLWYVEYLRRERLGLVSKPNPKKRKINSGTEFCGKKTVFCDDDD